MKDKKLGYYQSLRWLDSNGARELINLIAKIELTEQELIQQITHGEADNSLAVYVDIGVSDGAIDSDRGFIAMTLGRKQRLVALDGRKLGRSPLSLFVYHEAEYRPDGMVFLPSQPKDKTITLEDFLGGDKGLGLWSADTKSLKPRYLLYFFRSEVEEWAKRIGGEPDPKALQEENQHLRQEIEALMAEVERLEVESSALKQVGGGATQELGFTHITDNLKLVAATQQEFYDDDFDINDKHTHPTRNFIKDWLRDKHGVVSDETRKAIERIATPFSRDRAKK